MKHCWKDTLNNLHIRNFYRIMLILMVSNRIGGGIVEMTSPVIIAVDSDIYDIRIGIDDIFDKLTNDELRELYFHILREMRVRSVKVD